MIRKGQPDGNIMSATRSIAVVAERQDFYNAGLAALLQQEIGFAQVLRVRDYAGLAEIVALDFSIDFLALDFDLPGSSGVSTIRLLREQQPTMRMAVFSDRTDLRDVLSILAAGAHGFIPKQISNCDELLHALLSVEEDGIFVPPSLLDREPLPSSEDGEDVSLAGPPGLTGRQQQVLKLLSEGYANKVIARELGISPSTVKVHVQAAFRALGVHSRLAAMAALRPMQRNRAEA